MYGSYMTSHNIGPHEGDNNPKYQQVFEAAELKAAKRKPKAPEPPRKCKEEDRLNPEQVEELKTRQPVLSAPRKFPSKEILKPDLYEAKRFKSEHNTPDTSNLQEARPVTQASKAEHKLLPGRTREAEVNLSRTVPRGIAAPTTAPAAPLLSQTTKQPVLLRPSQEVVKPVSVAPPAQRREAEQPRLKAIREEPQEEETKGLDEGRIEDEKESRDPDEVRTEGEACSEVHHHSPSRRFTTTSYQAMTGKNLNSEPLVYEPFRYCKNCQSHLLPERPELTVEDMLRPPRHLGELPVQELDPKIYR
jgi:hypothetical protein